MAKTRISPTPSSYSSFLSVSRSFIMSGELHDAVIDAEYFDKAKATSEDIAEACSNSTMVGAAASACALAHKEDAPPPESAVYIIGAHDQDACKIGVAANPLERLASIQTGNWHELRIRALFWVIEGSAIGIEQLSLRIAQKMGRRVRGEWVDLGPEGAAYIVASVIHSATVRVADSGMWLRQRDKVRQAKSDWRLQSSAEKKAAPHGYASSDLRLSSSTTEQIVGTVR